MDFETVIDTVRRETNMEETLRVLGIQVVRKAFLCPFHKDEHLGNCRILDRDRARCFACNQSFNSIDLVMQINNLGFRDAVKFIYTNVLGIPLDLDNKTPKCILDYQQLKTIGLTASLFTKAWNGADKEEKELLKAQMVTRVQEQIDKAYDTKRVITKKLNVLKEIGLFDQYMGSIEKEIEEKKKIRSILRRYQ